MKKRITRVGPWKVGAWFAVLHAGLMCSPFLAAGVWSVSRGGGLALFWPANQGTSQWLAIAVPLVGISFIVGVFVAVLYNLVAGWTGGIEITLEDVEGS